MCVLVIQQTLGIPALRHLSHSRRLKNQDVSMKLRVSDSLTLMMLSRVSNKVCIQLRVKQHAVFPG